MVPTEWPNLPPPLQVSAAGFDGGRACMELCHAAEAGGQYGATEALPPAGTTTQGCQAQRESGKTVREPKCWCQDQTWGTGTWNRDTEMYRIIHSIFALQGYFIVTCYRLKMSYCTLTVANGNSRPTLRTWLVWWSSSCRSGNVPWRPSTSASEL